MANYLTADTDLTAVADAIRAKGGTNEPLSFPAEFVNAIGDIQTGGGGQDYAWECLVDHLVTATEAGATSITFTQNSYPNINGQKRLAIVVVKPPNSTTNTPWWSLSAGSVEVINVDNASAVRFVGIAEVVNGRWLQGSNTNGNSQIVANITPHYVLRGGAQSDLITANATFGWFFYRNKSYSAYTSLRLSSYTAFLPEGTRIVIFGAKG